MHRVDAGLDARVDDVEVHRTARRRALVVGLSEGVDAQRVEVLVRHGDRPGGGTPLDEVDPELGLLREVRSDSGADPGCQVDHLLPLDLELDVVEGQAARTQDAHDGRHTAPELFRRGTAREGDERDRRERLVGGRLPDPHRGVQDAR